MGSKFGKSVSREILLASRDYIATAFEM